MGIDDNVGSCLEQADRMTLAFDPDLLTVDLIGEHANVLSLVVWPAQSYVSHVSSIVGEYSASADTKPLEYRVAPAQILRQRRCSRCTSTVRFARKR
jgi:hypothetical protein